MKGERVAQLELLLRSHPEGLRRAEIARRLGVHRSTISRYVEDLSTMIDIYEDNNLIKINEKAEEDTALELSVYESLAFNLSAEALIASTDMQNPHLASGLRKMAMNMRSYAPKISENILSLADSIDSKLQKNKTATGKYNAIMEVLIDCWVSGRIARITTEIPEQEEIEISPYFIGFKDENEGRKPMTVTGRLRHTKDIITLDIADITNAIMLDETYTIPDNLKPFRKQERDDEYDAVDMLHLTLELTEKSAINSFSSLMHKKPVFERSDKGTLICNIEVENSIELTLRIIQGGTSITVLGPESYKKKLVSYLESILKKYR
ncbi:MAG: WYL domain-containing protein [Spirochaetales bacterium]|nr:WYL domain-containing protein [Spirochaetales bacterium]